jgi:hypothetical protein
MNKSRLMWNLKCKLITILPKLYQDQQSLVTPNFWHFSSHLCICTLVKVPLICHRTVYVAHLLLRVVALSWIHLLFYVINWHFYDSLCLPDFLPCFQAYCLESWKFSAKLVLLILLWVLDKKSWEPSKNLMHSW